MKKLTSEEFDAMFDAGEDMTPYIDFSKGHMIPPRAPKRVNVDFTVSLLKEVDKEAEYVGVPRQSILKMWIAERVEQNQMNRRLARK